MLTFKPPETLNPSSGTIFFVRNPIFEVPRPQTGQKSMFLHVFNFYKISIFKWPYLDKYEDLEGRTGTDLHLFSSLIFLDRFWAPLLSADAGF